MSRHALARSVAPWLVLLVLCGTLASAAEGPDMEYRYPPVVPENSSAPDFSAFFPYADAVMQASAQQSIAQLQAKLGDIVGAKRTVAQITQPGDRPESQLAQLAIAVIKARTLGSIAVVEARDGDIGGAKRTVNQMGDGYEVTPPQPSPTVKQLTAEEIGDIKTATLRRIATIQAAAGDIAGAKRTISLIRN
jgi:hypothetical protein